MNNSRGHVPAEPHRRELIARVLGSYAEMPGLCLRLEQASRLFGIALHTCEAVLLDLVREGRLRRTLDGQFARAE